MQGLMEKVLTLFMRHGHIGHLMIRLQDLNTVHPSTFLFIVIMSISMNVIPQKLVDLFVLNNKPKRNIILN